MTADELRELADALAIPSAYTYGPTDPQRKKIADYLRACADAMEKGPVAWRISIPGEPELGNWFGEVPLGEGYTNEALYPLAMPAQAQPLRLPEPLTDDEVDALIDETGHMTTDRAVRYLVKTGERRVKEVNE